MRWGLGRHRLARAALGNTQSISDAIMMNKGGTPKGGIEESGGEVNAPSKGLL